MKEYVPIIGMEIHIELKTDSGMFCSCKNNPDEREPNTNICEICLGHPGSLPTPNKRAIELTVLMGKALNCSIATTSKFDRKHYFYPDLPKGYQISQYDEPIAEHGSITLTFPLQENVRDSAKIGILRAHLEEDTAKLVHGTEGETYVDFNRAGVPLLEIVTDPDFKSSLEAKTYCQELQLIARYLGASDADMEKGHMRCEANVSVQQAGHFEIVDGVVKPLGDYVLNPKVEVKNINSFKAVEKSIEFEINRQIDMLEEGTPWVQQTRGWDEDKGVTVMQRTKENAADYRYFPEPDIPPFDPSLFLDSISLTELPQAKRIRFHDEYGFSYADSKILTDNKEWANFTEQTMSELIDWLYSLPEVKGDTDEIKENKKQKIARLAGGWLTSKLMGMLKERKKNITDVAFSAENFAELMSMVYAGRVNSTNAQKILVEMVDSATDLDPSHIMEEKGYGQISDTGALQKIVDAVVADHPNQVEQFKSGKEPIMKFLVGMVMKATEGSADPNVAEELLRNSLK